MDAAADAMSTPLGAWASIRGYLTPATLFLVLNLVIGTIALTSRSRDQRRRREHHHDYAHHHPEAHYQEPLLQDPQHQQEEYHSYQPPPAPLARTSSVLDRLRSIGLYRFRSGDFPPEYAAAAAANPHHDAFAPVDEQEAATKQYARSRSEPAPAREAPPPRTKKKKSGAEVVRKKSRAARDTATRVVAEHEAVDARAEEFAGSLRHEHEQASPQRAAHLLPYQGGEGEGEEYVPPPAPMRAPPPLSRTSSVLDRLRSLGLYSFLAADAPTPDAFAGGDKNQAPAPAHYDRSRSEPAREQAGEKVKQQQQVAEARMAKSSSSTARKAAAGGPSLVSQQSVNARAEAFIDSFRKGQSQKQQLHHDEDDDDHHVVPPPPAPLERTSSVMDRLRSFSLYLRSGDPAAPEDPADEKTKQAAQYGRSRSEPARDQGRKKAQQEAQAKMSKTSSETNIAEEAAEECVNARADDFINKFRQQLQLQRLNSLLSYGGTKQ